MPIISPVPFNKLKAGRTRLSAAIASEPIPRATKNVSATVSFMTQKMKIEFDEGADEKAVMKHVLKNCRKVDDDCEIFF